MLRERHGARSIFKITTDVGGNYGWTYGYDNIYQVTNADQASRSPQRNVDFGYDSVYNRTLWTDTLGPVNTSYQDNALHQYTLVGAVTPTYDNNGNVTSFDGAMTMGYDCENRLQTAGAVSYGYDLLGRRISRDYSTSHTVHVYDGPHIIAEYSTTGTLVRKYIYGPGIDNPVAMIRRLGDVDYWYYYYTDVLGSVRLLTNASGAVVESYTYDPYGQPRVMYAAGTDGNWLTEDVVTYTSSLITRGNPIMFTGRWWDSSTKLYYYRFRDYSPTLGRFLQPDPAKYIDGMNLYAYCGNNPINWIDPWGLAWYDKPVEWAKAIGEWFMNWFEYKTPDATQGITAPAKGILGAGRLASPESKKRAYQNFLSPATATDSSYTWDPANHQAVYVEPMDIDGDKILNWDSNQNFVIDEGDINEIPNQYDK